MERYEKYKDSGIEWIGEIPEQWDVKKIKHRCYVKGRVGWKGLKSSEFLTNGFSYLVTGTDFKNDTVDWDNCYHIDEERYNEDPYIQLQNEDLLITKDGTIGKLAVVTNLDKPACLNSGIFVVRSTKEDFSTRYLLWVLKSSTFTDFNGLTAYGSTIQHLYQNVFVEFAFAFPPVQTQISIADYLRKKTTEIDQIIANKQKLIALYEEEKQAIINQAVTKGLDPNVKMKDSGVEWLGEIPEHWEVKKLKFVATINDETLPETTDEDYSIEYIEISDVKSGIGIINTTNYSFKDAPSRARRIVKKGDVIVSTVRTYLKSIAKVESIIENLIASTGFAVIRSRKIDSNYVGYLFYSEQLIGEIISHSTGVSYPAINATQLGDFFIPIPPVFEQLNIVTHIEKECNRLDAIIEKFNKQIDLLQEYRTTLISEVVRGKIKVC